MDTRWVKATHTLAVNTVPWVQNAGTKVKHETKDISQIRNYVYPNGTSQKVKMVQQEIGALLPSLTAELNTWDSHGKRDSNPVGWPRLHIPTKWISASALGCGYTVLPEVTSKTDWTTQPDLLSLFNAYLRILILTRTFRS